jgi:hypothetical protein
MVRQVKEKHLTSAILYIQLNYMTKSSTGAKYQKLMKVDLNINQ